MASIELSNGRVVETNYSYENLKKIYNTACNTDDPVFVVSVEYKDTNVVHIIVAK